MVNPSNLYAEKVFAEHPIALWSLDDDAGFASFIPDANKDLTTWTKTGAGATLSAFDNANFPYPPLEDEDTLQVSLSGAASTVTLTSTATFTSTEAETFSIGFYFYDNNKTITKIEVGYGANLFEVDVPKNGSYIVDSEWLHISKQITATVSSAASIVIKVTYGTPGAAPTFLINGFSIGNHSEEFNGSTTGQYPSTFPATVSFTGTGGDTYKVISADSYGYANYDGYYVVKNGKLLASNSGMPMVYGAQSSTACFYNDSENDPCVILPAAGFLHANGTGNNLSLEAWLRISTTATEEKRILGPIGSTDGLYVKGPFFLLKIDTKY
jgi:hypothetical protein